MWSPPARAAARDHMADQEGMRAIGDVLEQLAAGRIPVGAEPFGDSTSIWRLRVGPYRLLVELAADPDEPDEPEPVAKVFYLGKAPQLPA